MADESSKEHSQPEPEKKVLGGYEIIAKVGQGGAGMVFKAVQVSVNRIVALKVLPPRLAKNKHFVERFLREARSAAKLDHPNIVQAIDAGETGGYYYFAMEFIDGPTLSSILDERGPLPERRALEIARDVARALDYAHQSDMVHRDVKPSNILLTSDGKVKLADLGLAREMGQTDQKLTQLGTAIGSPDYISPEQIRGEDGVDGRTDIYSLGATLYHMLVGFPPYKGGTATELMAKHLTEPVPDPRQVNPKVSAEASRIVRKMMAKWRDRRYTCVKELLHDIESLLARDEGGASAPSAPVTRRTVARTPGGRTGVKWAIAGVVAVAVLILAVVLLSGRHAGDTRAAGNAGIAEPPRAAQEVVKREVVQRNDRPATPTPEELAMLQRLRTEVAGLTARDRFGEAMGRVSASGKNTLGDAAKTELAQLAAGVTRQVAARWQDLDRQADAAVQTKDYSKARAVLTPTDSFGMPEYADKAARKRAEIDSHDKNAVLWARWDDIKKRATTLAESGEYDKAAAALDEAKSLPLDGIADLMAQEKQGVGAIRQKAAEKALADYANESDAVWALFKQRKYDDADTLLADLAKKPEYRPAANLLEADVEASKLLKQFWAAVEKGLAAKTGNFIAIAGAAGNLVSVGNGQVLVKTGDGEVKRSIYQLTLNQAIAYAQAMAYAEGGGVPVPPLVLAVARLAEGEQLEDADKALTAAGDAKYAGIWRERLAKLLPSAREALASQAWKRIESSAKGDLSKERAAELAAALTEFEKKYGGTQFARQVVDEIGAFREKVDLASFSQLLSANLGGGVKMDFIRIRPGSFMMGSEKGYANEKPVHKVTITKPFYMGKFEVTEEQWRAVTGENPTQYAGGGPKNPVANVSWAECQTFLRKLAKNAPGHTLRLPTEAEWEYACRAGSTTAFCYGDDEAGLKDYAWYGGNAWNTTHPVGQRKPNAWGLYDMHGNVWEWCQDWYAPYPTGDQTDPTGPATGNSRVQRGGSWNYPPAGCRSACRGLSLTLDLRNVGIGLRVVCDAGVDTGPAGVEQNKPMADRPVARVGDKTLTLDLRGAKAIIVDNTAPGFVASGTATWTTETTYKGHYGTSSHLCRVVNGAATGIATWSFTIPAPAGMRGVTGTLMVEAIWPRLGPTPTRGISDAKFTVYHEGADGLTSTVIPGVNLDGWGNVWTSLKVDGFQFKCGKTYRVELTNATTLTDLTRYITADAIRVSGTITSVEARPAK